MADKGTCELHGEFILKDGCPKCLAAKRVEHHLSVDEADALVQADIDEQEACIRASPVLPLEVIPAETALIRIKPNVDEAVIALHMQSLKLEQYAVALVIDDDDKIKSATNELSIISGLKKAIEEKRKDYIKPIKDHLEAVNDAFKTFTEPLLAADKITRNKMLAYDAEVDRKRAEQEEINRLRIEAAQKEMVLKGELTESVDLVEVTPEAPTTIRTAMGTASQTDHWKYEVTDFALLPDEYKLPDSTMLNAIAKKHHDQKQILGVRFYNEPFITVRTRKEE